MLHACTRNCAACQLAELAITVRADVQTACQSPHAPPYARYVKLHGTDIVENGSQLDASQAHGAMPRELATRQAWCGASNCSIIKQAFKPLTIVPNAIMGR
jgi:hypothetical protein